MSNVVETVNFKLAQGFTSQDLLSLNEPMVQFLKEQEGMLYRSLCEKEDGSYTDIVYWQDMTSAKQAQQAFFQSPVCEQFAQCIDKESVQLEHIKVIASQGCEG